VSANLIVAKDVSDVPLSKKGSEAQVKKAAGGIEYNNPIVHYSFVTFSQTLKGHENPISIKVNQSVHRISGQTAQLQLLTKYI
jgi:hypothetical protein